MECENGLKYQREWLVERGNNVEKDGTIICALILRHDSQSFSGIISFTKP